MESQRVGHNLTPEQQQQQHVIRAAGGADLCGLRGRPGHRAQVICPRSPGRSFEPGLSDSTWCRLPPLVTGEAGPHLWMECSQQEPWLALRTKREQSPSRRGGSPPQATPGGIPPFPLLSRGESPRPAEKGPGQWSGWSGKAGWDREESHTHGWTAAERHVHRDGERHRSQTEDRKSVV